MIVLYVLGGFAAFLVLLLIALAPLRLLLGSSLPIELKFVLIMGWVTLWLFVVPGLVVYGAGWLR